MNALHIHSSDRELIAALRTRAGDPPRGHVAPPLLDARYRARLTAFANRLLAGSGAHGRGEDVVQQVFCELVRGAEPGENVRAGLYVMTRARAIDELRRDGSRFPADLDEAS